MSRVSGDQILSRSWASLVADRSTSLAVELVLRGAQVVVVGGTALWLRGGSRWPRDLDLTVTEPEVPALVSALAQIGVHIRAETLYRCRVVALTSAWGPLDVFVKETLPRSGVVKVDQCTLVVAHD